MKVEEENESKRMLSDLSKRVDDLQDSVSKIAEALSYLVASSSDKEEKEELAEKVDLLSSYANECIEHNDAVCAVRLTDRIAYEREYGTEEGECSTEERSGGICMNCVVR